MFIIAELISELPEKLDGVTIHRHFAYIFYRYKTAQIMPILLTNLHGDYKNICIM